MRFSDMLRMSWDSLLKRKFRTVMTIMGVVIGTASIVVMVSLGLGLRRKTLESAQQWGSLTQIQVYSGNSDEYGNTGGTTAKNDDTSIYLNDDVVEKILNLEHVEKVEPILETRAVLRQGLYEASTTLRGVTPGYLEDLKIELESGNMLKEGEEVKLLYGNMAIIQFTNIKTNSSYWETQILPDVDLSQPVFVIYDTDAYYASKGESNKGVNAQESSTGSESSEPVKQPKKFLTEPAGVIAGGVDTYASYSWDVYAELNALTEQLRRVFRKNPIPGQPTRKNGKAYPDLFYSQLVVTVDDMENVSSVEQEIKNMGYVPQSDTEWIQSELEQTDSVQTMLGGIGAVSLLVAAIGIANTMMMSIYERTKEIGVYKVLGCALRNIRSMFLIEAAFIGFFGGVFGTALSYLVSYIINTVSSGDDGYGMAASLGSSYIPLWLSLSAVVFATGVGILSGLMPAIRAMRLSPLAAIRNE